ncbi:hypothetical protein DBR17_01160 [Sphingomonas sp. HMWF008]|nr:hypothetical protein DBR17_01160 [Sphingomonas sp. HMWF008]
MTTIGGPGPQTATDRVPPVPIKLDGALWSGPAFVDVLGALMPPSNSVAGFLEDTETATPLDGSTAPNASVFNAHGLFYGLAVDEAGPLAVGSGSIAQEISATAQPLNLLSKMAGESKAARENVTVQGSSPAAKQAFSGVIAQASPLTVSASAGPTVAVHTSIQQGVADAALAANISASATESDISAFGSRPARSARLARFFHTVGVQHRVAVSLQAVDRGQAVAAQVGDLDRAQRVRLRDRIVALLSRHGLAAASVRIDGIFQTTAISERDR